MNVKRYLMVLLAALMVLQLAVPCAAATQMPSVTMAVRPLTAEELPDGATVEDNLYGFFVRVYCGSSSSGQALSVRDFHLCFSIGETILPYDTEKHAVVGADELSRDCFGLVSQQSSAATALTVTPSTSDEEPQKTFYCRYSNSVAFSEESDLFVMYFQIRDNDASLLGQDSFQPQVDPDILAQFYASSAIYLYTSEHEYYVYGGSMDGATVLPDYSVRFSGLDQSVSITGAQSVAVPKAGEPDSTLALDWEGPGWTGDYLGSADAVWSITDDGGTGAVIDPNTGVLTVPRTGQAGTAQVQLEVRTDSAVKTASASVSVTREPSEATGIQILRDGRELTDTDTVIQPAGTGTSWSYTYEAVLLDQYGLPMPGEVNWCSSGPCTTSPEGNRLTLTVAPEAQSGSILELSAVSGTLEKAVQITVADLEPDWAAVDDAIASGSLTYGQPVSALAALPKTGTVQAAGESLPCTFSYADGYAELSAGSHSIEVLCTVTGDSPYAGASLRKSYNVTVGKKPITISADDAEMVCNAPLPDFTFTVPAGALESGDLESVLHVSLSANPSAAASPGNYPITGTAEADNYEVTVTPGTLTVKPDAVASVTDGTGSPLQQELTVSAWDVEHAQTHADLGLPSEVTITGSQGKQATVPAVWEPGLADLAKQAANAKPGAPVQAVVTLSADTFPEWAAAPAELPEVTLEILDKYTISEEEIHFSNQTITYGDSYTPDAPVVDSKYGPLSFTYTYDGLAEVPTNAGSYICTVTVENDRYRGTASAELVIQNKPLDLSMVTMDDGPFVYDGSPIQPSCQVSDIINGREAIRPQDYTVSYAYNIQAADPHSSNPPQLIVTANLDGNYRGSVTVPFTIQRADLSAETPVITGTGTVGSVLTAVLPDIDDAEYTCQWYRDGVEISGAVGASYVVTSADSGRNITVQAAAAEKNYTGRSAMSAPVTIATQAITGTVTISVASHGSGEPDTAIAVGDTLLAETQLTPQVAVTYQWYLDGAAVPGATAETFLVPSGSAGKSITVTVRPSDSNYTGSVTSQAVVVGRALLRGTVALTRDGDTVTAALSGNLTASSCTVVWLRNGVEIPGASGLTYSVTDADRGTELSAKAVALGDYTGEIVSEPLTIPASVPDAPVVSVTPGDREVTISWKPGGTGGAPVTGYRLTVMANGQVLLIKEFSAQTTQFTATELVNGVSYTFTVTAINGTGQGADGSISASPEAPEEPGPGPSGGGGDGGKPEEPEVKPVPDFEDVDNDGWSAPYIYDLCARGIVQGVGNNRFAPTRAVTRAEFVRMLAGVAGVEEAEYSGRSSFEDVDPDAWYAPWVAWAAETGVTTGVSETRFQPDGTITREQMAAMLYRFTETVSLKLPATEAPADFTDAGEFSPWAVDAISALQRAGILNGVGGGRFAPDGAATREQACKMLSQLLELLEA